MGSKREFGSGSRTFRRGFNRKLGSTRANSSLQRYGLPTGSASEPTVRNQRFEHIRKLDEIESRFGFDRYKEGPERLGWLINMHETVVPDSEWPGGRAAVKYYFLDENGETFKVLQFYSPYFYIGCKPGTEGEVEEYLRRKFESTIEQIKRIQKEDLKQPNHLIGRKRTFLQLCFRNVSDLLTVRKVILPEAKKNEAKLNSMDMYTEVVKETIRYESSNNISATNFRKNPHDALENIIDIREYDVPYYVRCAIDLDIRVGVWYNAKALPDETVVLTRRHDLVHRPEPVVLAFDIETTKLPLKFPDATIDNIMMISYMIDGRGYLITNREIVSEDIEDFEYNPKPEIEGPFTIFNEANEYDVIMRFFEHIQQARPTIFVSYNGDFFDWPFIEARAKVHGINMYDVIGVYKDDEDEYKCKFASHMDAFRWVKRDSYLPQGSQGLKAVTTAKLGYNPMELDPEDMTRFASEQPQTLAQYSVSDAVATYYLYMKYVHPFIFSLCNIIPLTPDEVLRKGTGTLCELLLMVEAYKANVIIPNKHVEDRSKMFEGHLLESETYVGGHVEALEAGVFRSDIDTFFKVDPEAAQQLIDQLDDALKFTLTVEEKQKLEDIVDYEQVRDQIKKKLEDLRDNPIRHESPLIYHLDVAAMYPNIILTNRLQPDAMIDESMCATCEFNTPDKTCDRRMTWSWRGEYFPAKRNEYNMIENQLSTEMFPPKEPKGQPRTWQALDESERTTLLHKRLTDYCKKVYKKVRETKTIERESIICQRENPFYIGTVRAFRDRRYEYKGLHKKWKQNLDKALAEGAVTKVDEAKKMIVLYDSLQLAHKCILNSFYGYVMRKGARWHSLEMAGIVCLTGARIIQMARQLVERLGRPLELDTDGIWCILPKTFPETFAFTLANGKKVKIDYPCTMLNHLVHAGFTNHQYQTLTNPATFEYSVHSENSIFFEIDGPYRAMILPASTHEDKLLKKRYAVFNDDGSLAELKGFEVKRRGELKLIKIFQSEIFKVFLQGKTLEECYAAVAQVANQWLDILYSKARNLHDEELFDLISENRSMSKTLEDYGAQKSTAISTAKRLAEFLGDQMVKDKGLACKFIISALPAGSPVSERAIPVTIFNAEPSIKKHYLRKWLKDNSLTSFDIRDILDWDYYLERFGSVIQKLITIPAAMQKVNNPVPRVHHPDWLRKRVSEKDDKLRQNRISEMFQRVEREKYLDDLDEEMNEASSSDDVEMNDIEDLDIGGPAVSNGQRVGRVTKRKRRQGTEPIDEDLPETMPDMYEDYQGWLAYQKLKWKRQRLLRAKRREANGRSSQGLSRGDVGGFFRRQTGSLVSSTWEVLQITKTETAGEYRMWVSIQQRLVSIQLSVPRIFYLNCREDEPTQLLEESPNCNYSKCVRTLPRSYPCYNLFEVIMSEENYQKECRKMSSIFNHPSTESVYETHVPLDVRALLLLGAHCSVIKEKAGRSRLEDKFNLLDLEPKLGISNSYLSNPKDYNYIYLYHDYLDNRHFFALLGSSLQTAECFIVGGPRDNQQLPNMRSLYRTLYQELTAQDNFSQTVELKPELEFQISNHGTEREALRHVNRALGRYQDAKHGPTMIVICSPSEPGQIIQYAKIINEFPYMTIPPRLPDGGLNALGWLQQIARRSIHSYLTLGTWIDEKVRQARYANVPICNIPDDAYLFLADILFARRLMKNDMVLWWSEATKPDLGGREEDENLAAITDIEHPQISNASIYYNVCIEIEIYKLCLNSIIEALAINELEGTTGIMGFDTSLHSLDEYSNNAVYTSVGFADGTLSAKTFTMLRNTVQQWMQESKQNNPTAAMMVDALHRWLQSPSSNMYDPCLYGVVHGMMKKVFMKLIAAIKDLGASIVHADFRKVILATTKESLLTAKPYQEYLFRTLQSKQIFNELELRLVYCWDVLIWMDEMNHGGIIANPDTMMTDVSTPTPEVIMHWNIQNYLAPATQPTFQKIIANFLSRIRSLKIEHPRDIRNQAQMDQDEENIERRVIETRNYVSHDVQGDLLRWILKATRKQATEEGYEFPELSGSHLQLSNPTLECVKAICHVLHLDPLLEDQVRVLKSNALLAVSGISEFSDEAKFQNPCNTFKLSGLLCTFCNYANDLDFCRDESLLPVNGIPQTWRCLACKVEFDKTHIEGTLISLVQDWAISFQVQDLQCPRCRDIKRENLLKHCNRCGSEFVTTQDRNDILRKVRVLERVAKEQGFSFLSDLVNWILSRSG